MAMCMFTNKRQCQIDMDDDCEVEVLNVPGSCNKEMEGAMEEGLPLSDGAECCLLKMLVPSMTN